MIFHGLRAGGLWNCTCLSSACKAYIMTTDKRRKQRRLLDCVLDVSWHDSKGAGHTISARAIDVSNSGVSVEASQPIEPQTEVYVRAERYGLSGSTRVCHCSRRGTKYVLGLEFNGDVHAGDNDEAESFVDYYELLQISPNAEAETIHRVFRIMAARFHPDNSETGDSEKFLLLTKAYETLSNPARQAAYDERHRNRRSDPLPVFALKEFVEGLGGEANRRLGILSLLYNKRRANPDNPGMSVLDFERVMSFPREHLEFAIWYLSERQYIRSIHNSDHAITAIGLEYLESELPSNHALSKLLHAPEQVMTTGPAVAPKTDAEPEHSLALISRPAMS
jgi:curved DNA-binding protein